jgi:hypothetical protein
LRKSSNREKGASRLALSRIVTIEYCVTRSNV